MGLETLIVNISVEHSVSLTRLDACIYACREGESFKSIGLYIWTALVN